MERTNEELALLVQSGQSEHIPQLWAQVEDFVKYMADKHLKGYPAHFQQFHGDMVNQAYFYFLRAIEGYQEEKGKFTSYLSFHIKNAFSEVLQGRTSKAKNEPLNAALSLDSPIEGAEDITLADMLIDTQSEAYHRRIEDREFWQSVNGTIREAIEAVAGDYADFFLVMLENGTGVSDTLRIMGVDLAEKGRYYERYRSILRKLRQHIMKRLRQQQGRDIALEEYISYHTSVSSWRHRRFTSTVEQAVMRRNDPRYTAQAVEGVLALQPWD